MKLQNAVSAVVDWRRNIALGDLWLVCYKAEYFLQLTICMSCLIVMSCRVWINLMNC